MEKNKDIYILMSEILTTAKAIMSICEHLQNDHDPYLVHAVSVLAESIADRVRELRTEETGK